MSLDRESLARAVARHGRIARVTVAATEGSAPREPGAAMLVWADGQSGTIGGGALEWQAATEARVALAQGRDRIARKPLGPALGQCCGGAVVLVTELIDAARLAGIPETHWLRRVEGAAEAPLALRRAAAEARGTGTPPPARLQNGWLLEPVARASRPLWIHGAGHMGRALVHTLAPLPEVAITWTDTAPERFPDTVPDRVTVLSAANPADTIGLAPPEAHHLILTYSHALDLELCHRLLLHGFASAGLIGSKTKRARFRARLGRLGHAPAQIARIRCPIGDPSLGKHPQAIAIGVAAELLAPAAAHAQEAQA